MGTSALTGWELTASLLEDSGWEMTRHPDGTIIFTKNSQKGTDMSDQHARMRVTLDLPVDPSTASPRVLKALANEARDYVQVVLVKDREITLTDHVEVIDVHVHNSPSPAEACDACVRELALDGRS